MNKIFLDELIKFEGGNNKGKINWTSNVGSYVNFTYGSISDKLLIKSYNINNHHLVIEYNKKLLDIYTTGFRKCQIGKLFNFRKYKYDIDDIVNTKGGQLKILSQTHMLHGKNNINSCFAYMCECLNCGNKKYLENKV